MTTEWLKGGRAKFSTVISNIRSITKVLVLPCITPVLSHRYSTKNFLSATYCQKTTSKKNGENLDLRYVKRPTAIVLEKIHSPRSAV